jgi:hypothetical protein
MGKTHHDPTNQKRPAACLYWPDCRHIIGHGVYFLCLDLLLTSLRSVLMEQDKIILWAIKAHMEASAADENCRVPHFDDVTLEELEAFAKLVAAHEREQCAMVCETHAPTTTPTWVSYAAAIRARGNHA